MNEEVEMSEQNKALIRQYIAAISGKDKPDSIVNIFVKDDHLKQHIKTFETAFPRYKILIEDLIAEADKVVVRASLQGTHKGELPGITPTGKKINLEQVVIYRITNGKINQHWMKIDNIELLKQLGLILNN